MIKVCVCVCVCVWTVSLEESDSSDLRQTHTHVCVSIPVGAPQMGATGGLHLVDGTPLVTSSADDGCDL